MRFRMQALIVIIATVVVSGCETLKSMDAALQRNRDESSMRAVDASKDQYMARKFYPLPATLSGYSITNVNTNIIQIERPNHTRNNGNVGGLKEFYISSDSSKDNIAKYYLDTIKERGNTAKLFRSPVNSMIANMISKPRSSFPYYTDWDPALIEYDSNGRVVSALVRFDHVTPAAGYLYLDQINNILFDNFAGTIEMSLGNNVLNDNYITTMQ